MKYKKLKKAAANQAEQNETAVKDEAAQAVKGDDRNLVLVDEDFKEADFEERVWLMWNRNRGAIVAGILFGVLGVVAVWCYRFNEANKVLDMQEAFLLARSPAQLENFANKYADKALGGIAFLDAADRAYQSDNFAGAAELYKKAELPLRETPFAYRAQLGQAVSLVRAGKADDGKTMLDRLSGDSKAPDSLRAEAHYHIAIMETEKNNFDAARTHLDAISALRTPGEWATQAEYFRAVVPALDKKK